VQNAVYIAVIISDKITAPPVEQYQLSSVKGLDKTAMLDFIRY